MAKPCPLPVPRPGIRRPTIPAIHRYHLHLGGPFADRHAGRRPNGGSTDLSNYRGGTVCVHDRFLVRSWFIGSAEAGVPVPRGGGGRVDRWRGGMGVPSAWMSIYRGGMIRPTWICLVGTWSRAPRWRGSIEGDSVPYSDEETIMSPFESSSGTVMWVRPGERRMWERRSEPGKDRRLELRRAKHEG